MPLSHDEKAQRKRKQLIENSRIYSATTYCRKNVAPLFQRMIRAEAAAQPEGMTLAVVDGKLLKMFRCVGQVVCITCGKVDAWDSGIKGMHTGHFIGSRRNSILMESNNVAPQCSGCNFCNHGMPVEFRIWMQKVRGKKVIQELENLKRQSVTFIRDDLVDMRIEFAKRLKAAVESMKGI
jgi:hypothetical protein